MRADHIRWGIYMFGDAPSPLADALNGGGARVEPVTRSAWGWRCGGCGGVREARRVVGNLRSVVAVPPEDFAAEHATHASWVNHPDYCLLKSGGACSCGRTT